MGEEARNLADFWAQGAIFRKRLIFGTIFTEISDKTAADFIAEEIFGPVTSGIFQKFFGSTTLQNFHGKKMLFGSVLVLCGLVVRALAFSARGSEFNSCNYFFYL